MKGQTKAKDTAPQNERCDPYVCDGEGGQLHRRHTVNRKPCPECWFYRLQLHTRAVAKTRFDWELLPKPTTQTGRGKCFQKNRS